VDSVFIQISVLLAITTVIAFVVRLFRQPLIIAYIFAGIASGPLLLNLLEGDHHMYQAFAQFGVVLLLFIIGLNLNFRHLKSIGKVSMITGVGQVLFTGSIGTLILWILGFGWLSALYVAVAITFSSTIIIMKLLSDKKDTETTYGRYTIGLMLVQDIIAVLIMIGLGMFAIQHAEGGGVTNTIVWLVAKISAIIVLFVGLSKYVLPRVLDRISNSSELLFIFTLAWCFGAASLLRWAGFSLEIGAIIAGISLSSSPYQLEIASRIKPLRDFFLVLFFIVLGSEMGLSNFSEVFVPGIILSLFILIGNPIVLYILFRWCKFTRRNSFLAGLTAAQVSEFGFVILFTGRQIGHIQGTEIPIFTVVAITTIFLSSYLITYSERIYEWLLPVFRWFGPDKYRQSTKPVKKYDVWVVGYHRIGRKIVETLRAMKTRHAVIDFDPHVVKKLRADNTPFYFGDIADIEFLEGLPLGSSTMIVMTIPSIDDQINLIKHVKKINAKVLIIANSYQAPDTRLLYEYGADFVMMPHALGGHWMAAILRDRAWNKRTLASLRAEQELAGNA